MKTPINPYTLADIELRKFLVDLIEKHNISWDELVNITAFNLAQLTQISLKCKK